MLDFYLHGRHGLSTASLKTTQAAFINESKFFTLSYSRVCEMGNNSITTGRRRYLGSRLFIDEQLVVTDIVCITVWVEQGT